VGKRTIKKANALIRRKREEMSVEVYNINGRGITSLRHLGGNKMQWSIITSIFRLYLKRKLLYFVRLNLIWLHSFMGLTDLNNIFPACHLRIKPFRNRSNVCTYDRLLLFMSYLKLLLLMFSDNNLISLAIFICLHHPDLVHRLLFPNLTF
jgi:hypothetical protein